MMAAAFDYSERICLPVLMRVTTRMAHSRAVVQCVDVPRQQNALNYNAVAANWVLLPAIARRQYAALVEKQKDMEHEAAVSPFNKRPTDADGKKLGIIACGIGYNYVTECQPKDAAVLKISHYPLPAEQVRELAAACQSILVVEDGQPVVENEIKGILGSEYEVRGRLTGDLPRTGELTPDNVAAALGTPSVSAHAEAKNLAPRPPQLCPGCGHRDVYTALNKVAAEIPGARIFGDIGCYTLGALKPFESIASCVDMGASITMAKGAADAGLRPAIAVIGDSTFTHSGMTGLLDAVNDKSPITVIISDNLTTAMTGGQDSAGTNKFEAICLGLGVEPEHVRVVVPLPKNMEEITRILREEIQYEGVSVIIPRRECIQTLQRHLKEKKLKG